MTWYVLYVALYLFVGGWALGYLREHFDFDFASRLDYVFAFFWPLALPWAAGFLVAQGSEGHQLLSTDESPAGCLGPPPRPRSLEYAAADGHEFWEALEQVEADLDLERAIEAAGGPRPRQCSTTRGPCAPHEARW